MNITLRTITTKQMFDYLRNRSEEDVTALGYCDTLERQLDEVQKLLQRVSVSTTASDVKTWRDTMDAVNAYLYQPAQNPARHGEGTHGEGTVGHPEEPSK